MDPHIFADSGPGSQNLADPTDPDPKHWKKVSYFVKLKLFKSNILVEGFLCNVNFSELPCKAVFRNFRTITLSL